MKEQSVDCETVRLVDYNIAPGNSSDMGDGDQWPIMYDKIKKADILVPSMPVWMGVRSSQCQIMCERLDGSYQDVDPKTGQYPLYGKVVGAIVTGNEDGPHACCAITLYNFTHYGCTAPANGRSRACAVPGWYQRSTPDRYCGFGFGAHDGAVTVEFFVDLADPLSGLLLSGFFVGVGMGCVGEGLAGAVEVVVGEQPGMPTLSCDNPAGSPVSIAAQHGHG